MDWLKEFARRIHMLLHRRQFRADLDEEMQLHLDLRQQQQEKAGVPLNEARFAARRRFGNSTALKEKSHMSWGWTWLESLAQDTLYGIRAMLRSPVLTIVALLSLALGIGANTAIFTFMDAVMLRSLPVNDPKQLVVLGPARREGITDSFAVTDLYSYPVYRQFQQKNQVFSNVAAIFSLTNGVHGYVAERTEQEPMNIQLVSGTYFPMLGVQALLGRTLNDADDNSEGNHPVAVVSYAWWTRSLARDPTVLDKTLHIGSTVFNIVGVAPPEFFGTKVGESPDIWIPLSMGKAVPPHWGGYTDNFYEPLYIMGRMKPGVSVEQATANVNLTYQQIFHGLLGSYPDKTKAQKNRDAIGKSPCPAHAHGQRAFLDSQRVLAAPQNPHGRSRAGASHRLRQHRQPAAGPLHHARPRACRAPGARRRPPAHRPSALDRKPHPRARRWRTRHCLRRRGQPHAAAHGLRRGNTPPRCLHQRPAASVHARHHALHRDSLRHHSRIPRHAP